MNKKVNVSVALAITLIAMTVTFAITWLVSRDVFEQTVNSVTQRQQFYDKLGELDNYIRGNFYGTIDDAYLYDRVGYGFVSGLGDSKSTYYTEKDYLEMMEIQDGALVGIGVEVVKVPGGFRIVKIHPGSPAETAEMTRGSLIVGVNDENVTTLANTRQLKARLRGKQESEFTVTCLDSTGVTEKKFTIHRVNFFAPTVEWQMVDGYAYIRVSTITSRTATEFDTAVRRAQSENAKGIVLDLRGNTGGLVQSSALEQVFDMVDLLCPRGTIASAGLKSNVPRVLATSSESQVEQPIVVLVNAATTSAAELFAASIRSLANGQIVGVKTAGHGSLQRIPKVMSDGSAVSITYARLLFGHDQDQSFDEVGVIPDIEVIYENETEEALINPDFSADVVILRGLELVKSLARAKGLETAGPSASSSIPSSSSQSESSSSSTDAATSTDASTSDTTSSEATSDASTSSQSVPSSASAASTSSQSVSSGAA